jgi:plastocyanin
MMMRSARVAGVACALVLAVATPAQAVVAAAVPGSYAAGWATPVIVTPAGGPVTVANTDIATHQLIADGSFLPKKSAKKAPWCKGFSAKSCPLFWSEVVGTGQSTQVLGLQYIEAGGQYPFRCAIHPNMTGILVGT